MELVKDLDEIIMLGTGRSCCHCPEEKRPNTEVWGVPYTIHQAQADCVDRVFQIHTKKVLEREGVLPVVNAWVNAVNEKDIVVYTALDEWPELKKAVVFPLEKVLNEFGGMKFYLNTLCYMIALAIIQKPKKIQCYGVDMCDKLEYMTEKGCVEFWLGVAAGRGIEVATTPCSWVLGKASPTLKWFYGYETN